MSDFYDDNEIARLLGVRKELPINWQARLRLRARQELPQTRSSLIVRTQDGEFRIMMRQSTLNPWTSPSFSASSDLLSPAQDSDTARPLGRIFLSFPRACLARARNPEFRWRTVGKDRDSSRGSHARE